MSAKAKRPVPPVAVETTQTAAEPKRGCGGRCRVCRCPGKGTAP